MSPEKIIQYTFIGIYLTRTCAILLIVFGLKILISFYKYHIRMAAFSESVSQAIDIVGIDDISKLKALSEIISPEKIEFERNPDFLPEDIVALIKAITPDKK